MPAQQRFDDGARGFRQPDQHHRIILVVIGEVKQLRLALHQHRALILRNTGHNETVAIFLQAPQELLAHLQRRRAVGGAVFHLGPGECEFADVVEGHEIRLSHVVRSALKRRPMYPSLRAQRSNPESRGRLDCFVASFLAMTISLRGLLQRTAVKNRLRRKPDSQVVTGWLRMPRSQEPTTASARPTRSSTGNNPTPPSRTGTRLSAALSRLSPITNSRSGGTVTSGVLSSRPLSNSLKISWRTPPGKVSM